VSNDVMVIDGEQIRTDKENQELAEAEEREIVEFLKRFGSISSN